MGHISFFFNVFFQFMKITEILHVICTLAFFQTSSCNKLPNYLDNLRRDSPDDGLGSLGSLIPESFIHVDQPSTMLDNSFYSQQQSPGSSCNSPTPSVAESAISSRSDAPSVPGLQLRVSVLQQRVSF